MRVVSNMRSPIVEDEIKTASYLKRGLEENGFVADLADNGEDGAFLAQLGRTGSSFSTSCCPSGMAGVC